MLNKKQITKTFVELVKIDSPSGEESAVAKYIVTYLKNIGIKAREDKYGNVTAVLTGQGEALLICAHMDTVEPGRGIKPIVGKDIIKTDGSTILGADDKGAITEILEALKYIKEKKLKHRPLELVFTKEGETDFSGAHNIDFRQIKAKSALVLDYSLPPGAIVISSPFIYIFDVVVKGKSAHSGAFPEKGINAIKIAGDAISELKLGRIDSSTVANIGIIRGGLVRNGIPELVEIKGEVRSSRQASAQVQVDKINKAFKKQVRGQKARLNFKLKLDCYGYTHPRSLPLIKEIVKVNQRLKIETNYIKGGGVSDANVFNRKNISAVVISKGGRNPHSGKEIIKISEMDKMIEFLVEMVLV